MKRCRDVTLVKGLFDSLEFRKTRMETPGVGFRYKLQRVPGLRVIITNPRMIHNDGILLPPDLGGGVEGRCPGWD